MYMVGWCAWCSLCEKSTHPGAALSSLSAPAAPALATPVLPLVALPRPAPPAPNRRAASQSSIATVMYTGKELEEYAKESILPPALAVSILRGEMIPKSRGGEEEEGVGSRLHHSYEVSCMWRMTMHLLTVAAPGTGPTRSRHLGLRLSLYICCMYAVYMYSKCTVAATDPQMPRYLALIPSLTCHVPYSYTVRDLLRPVDDLAHLTAARDELLWPG
jgi:hypothetical protein